MIQKEVEVAKITTLADGTIRLSIDILSGDSDDISTAYKLKYIPTTMILVPTNDLRNVASADLNTGEVYGSSSSDKESGSILLGGIEPKVDSKKDYDLF